LWNFLESKTVLDLAVTILASSIAGSEKMRVAQVSPLYESCPPKLYGGTERVVSYLTEELVRQGHEVTLFASGDSQTEATPRAACDRALRLDPRCKDPLPHHLVMLNRVARSAEAFDIRAGRGVITTRITSSQRSDMTAADHLWSGHHSLPRPVNRHPARLRSSDAAAIF